MTSLRGRLLVSVFAAALGVVIVRQAHAVDVIVYQNGFESADTCAWAATVPGVTCDPEMVFVPAGEFTMGSNAGQEDEQPPHAVYLDAYWIDRTDVTLEKYSGCVSVGACLAPGGYEDDQFCNWGSPRSGDYPINCVEWPDATAFCAWANKRLPSEAEWEKAARGTDARTYPWGEAKPRCDYAVMIAGSGTCGPTGTLPVGSKPAGASPYGALDMAGNVWQLVSDWYDPAYYAVSPYSNPPGPNAGIYDSHVLRGGSWTGGSSHVSTTERFDDAATYDNHVGFRCALKAPGLVPVETRKSAQGVH